MYRCDNATLASAVETDFLGTKVPEDYVLEITHFAAGDETESGNVISVGYYTPTEDYIKLQSISDDDHFGVSLRGNVWLMAGERPVARITTPGSSDVIFFSCHGKLWPLEKEKPEIAEVQQESDLSDIR